MNAISRWIVFICLAFITVLMFNKGLDLRSLGTKVDGDGIGIYFLGLEINSRVPADRIPTYADGFFVTSMISMLIAITIFFWKSFIKLKGNKTTS
ncbi:hypothetical protein [Bacillus sp. FJAT-28004]|uniref:hypothetical protein n=1 Tax=Bacillus sp. FJAT-28004 TaxID=1679165 RepID=UPI0006B4F79C|nr:hypothetical protein [Bacillus sp. FJAT-28004]